MFAMQAATTSGRVAAAHTGQGMPLHNERCSFSLQRYILRQTRLPDVRLLGCAAHPGAHSLHRCRHLRQYTASIQPDSDTEVSVWICGYYVDTQQPFISYSLPYLLLGPATRSSLAARGRVRGAALVSRPVRSARGAVVAAHASVTVHTVQVRDTNASTEPTFSGYSFRNSPVPPPSQLSAGIHHCLLRPRVSS